MGDISNNMATVQVVYPQGIAWRKSPGYNDRITDVAGPTQMTSVQGQLVQGDVQYLMVAMPPGSRYQAQYLPLRGPGGQELARVTSQAPAPGPPAPAYPPVAAAPRAAAPMAGAPGYQQPPASYQQPPAGYQQPPVSYQQPPVSYQQPMQPQPVQPVQSVQYVQQPMPVMTPGMHPAMAND